MHEPAPTTRSILKDLAIAVAGFAALGIVIAVLAMLEDALSTPLWLSLATFGAALLGFLYIIFRPDLKRFREWRRRLQQRCPSCGYDRSGLANDAACPECGPA